MTPLLHCTKWHKSGDGNTKKCGNILRKYYFVPLSLPILNTLLSRTLTNTRDKKSQCWFYLKKLSSFKAAHKKNLLHDLPFQDRASHFQIEDPKEASRGLLCPLIQEFSQICTILNNLSPQRQCKCFFDRHLNEYFHPKRQSSSLLPAQVPGSSLCQHKLLCDCLTNWTTKLINCKHAYSVAEVFSTRSFPKWLGGTMNAFFFLLLLFLAAVSSLQPSYKPSSPDFSGLSTHADTEAEQH